MTGRRQDNFSEALKRFESRHQCSVKLSVLAREILAQVDEWFHLKEKGFEVLATARAVKLADACQAAAADCNTYAGIVNSGGLEQEVPAPLFD